MNELERVTENLRSNEYCTYAQMNEAANMLEAMRSRIAELEKDAARWNEVLQHVGAVYILGDARYVIRGITAPINVMRGAVSQHFEKSIDAAMQKD